MKLELTFPYVISVTPYRCQKAMTGFAQASASVDIVEIEPDAAPVALLVGNKATEVGYSDKRRVFSLKPDGTPRRVRVIDGSHYVERCPIHDLGDSSEKWLKETILARQLNWITDRATHQLTTLEDLLYNARRSHRGEPREIKDDGGAGAVAKIKRRAGMMFICEGALYEYTPEPVLFAYPDMAASIMPRPLVDWSCEDYDLYFGHVGEGSGEFYSLKDVEAAAQRVEQIGGEMPYVTVFESDSFTLDTQRYNLPRFMGPFESLADHCAKDMPWPYLDACYTLRDALAASGGEISKGVVDALRQISDLRDHPDQEKWSSFKGQSDQSFTHSNRLKTIVNFENFLQQNAIKLLNIADQCLATCDVPSHQRRWDQRLVSSANLSLGANYLSRELLSEGSVIEVAKDLGVDPQILLDAVSRGGFVLALKKNAGCPTELAVCAVSETGAIEAISDGQYAEFFEQHIRHGSALPAEPHEDDMPVLNPMKGMI